MARITVEDCARVFPNRFELVLLAAHKARQLSPDTQQLENGKPEPSTVRALREIASGTLDAGELRDDFIRSLQNEIQDNDPGPEDDLLQLDYKQFAEQARRDERTFSTAHEREEQAEELVT